MDSLAEEAELPGEAGQWLSDRKEAASWQQGEELVEGGGSPCEACGQRKRRLRASCSSLQDMLKDLRVLRGVAGTSLSDTCTDWWVGGGAAPLLLHDLHGRNRPALDVCSRSLDTVVGNLLSTAVDRASCEVHRLLCVLPLQTPPQVCCPPYPPSLLDTFL